MKTHPEADGLADIELPITEIQIPWYRIHRKAFGAMFFGNKRINRFDCPDGTFGVLYLATNLEGAFIETFGQETGKRFVQESELEERAFSIFESSRPLRLVDITGPGLAKMGADARLCAGDRNLAARWSSAFYKHANQPDGIYFRARHDPAELCSAVFDRAEPFLKVAQTIGLTDRSVLARIVGVLDRYDFGLVDS